MHKQDIASFDLPCDCGCSILQLTVDKDEEEYAEGNFSIYELGFYTHQSPFWSDFKKNVKLIWYILRGRRFCLYEVVIPAKKMEEFKEFVANIK